MRVTHPPGTASTTTGLDSAQTADHRLGSSSVIDGAVPTASAMRAQDVSHLRNRRRRGSRIFVWGVVGAVLLSLVSADTPQAETAAVVAQQVTTVSGVFANIRNWLIGILAGLATVFLTIGGVRYLLAGGDPGEVEKAKQAFKSAGWGYGLAALAPVIVEILKGIVGI